MVIMKPSKGLLACSSSEFELIVWSSFAQGRQSNEVDIANTLYVDLNDLYAFGFIKGEPCVSDEE